MDFISSRMFRSVVVIVAAVWSLLLATQHTTAQTAPGTGSPPAGAIMTGRAETGSAAIYRINDLAAGDVLYVSVVRESGNLDPIAYLLTGDADVSAARNHLRTATETADREGRELVSALRDAASEVALAWDDDSGGAYNAQFQAEIPADGDYLLVVNANPVIETFGDFRLLVGVNTPEVAEGRLTAPATLDIVLDRPSVIEAVEVLTGTVTIETPDAVHRLVDMRAGDTFTAYVETTDGSLVPGLILEDFGGKALAANNLQGSNPTALLSYIFSDTTANYRLRVRATTPNGNLTSGDYRLVLGRNTPGAITGDATSSGPAIVKAPVPVTAALRIDQITDVDQVAENFSVVASWQVEWHDPLLAFSPSECQCQQKLLRTDRVITDHFTRNNINEWPASYVYNQQGGRNAQSQLLAIEPDGSATYYERFTATLQAPDFNFRRFPFDTQQFYVRVQSLFEEEYYIFEPDAERSGFGPQLGEEQWIFSNDNFEVSTVTVNDRSQAVFAFTTHRHLNFYLFRIFVPVLLIILVSWVTFFLRDYGRRIEVASGNLLLFIAYNFTIANDLPRIGYLTFMDFVLISTFIITGVVVILNVIFRRMEANGKGETLEKLDRVLIWLYPLLYLGGGLIVYLNVFRPFKG